MEENPYKSLSGEKKDADHECPQLRPLSVSLESIESLEFTEKLVRGVSLFCFIGSFPYLYITGVGFYYLRDYPFGWMHISQAYRLLFFPSMLCLGIFGWKYANVIRKISKQKELEFEYLTTAQGYFWLFVVLYVFIILCGVALSITASWVSSNGEVW